MNITGLYRVQISGKVLVSPSAFQLVLVSKTVLVSEYYWFVEGAGSWKRPGFPNTVSNIVKGPHTE